MKRWLLFILIFLLCACTPFANTSPTDAPTPDQAYTTCAWQWAYQDLSELTTQWRAALGNLNLPMIEDQTSAYAYGENCIGQNGEFIRFAAMETDFNVALAVADANDITERAALIEPVMQLVIDSFPPSDSVPGPQKGFVEFGFNSLTEQKSLRVPIDLAESAFAVGKTGIDFYSAVTTQP